MFIMAMLTTREVAARLHLHKLTVGRYIRDGKIKAANFGGRYRVDEEEVEAFKRRSEATKQEEAKTA
jgi:excisionase family DNA binding protein